MDTRIEAKLFAYEMLLGATVSLLAQTAREPGEFLDSLEEALNESLNHHISTKQPPDLTAKQTQVEIDRMMAVIRNTITE